MHKNKLKLPISGWFQLFFSSQLKVEVKKILGEITEKALDGAHGNRLGLDEMIWFLAKTQPQVYAKNRGSMTKSNAAFHPF